MANENGDEGRWEDVAADLDKILDGMEMVGDETFVYYDRATGEVVGLREEYLLRAESELAGEEDLRSLTEWEEAEVDTGRAVLEDEAGRFVPLPDRFEIDEWDMMRRFSYQVSDEELSGRLLDAIHGKGAFRRFKDTLYQAGIQEEWFEFRDQQYREIAQEWCEWKDIPVKEEAAQTDL